MKSSEAETFFSKGLNFLSEGNTLSALSFFEKSLNIEDNPSVWSYLAFCIAKERGQITRSISLCLDAIKQQPDNSSHYLNLGRIYLFINKKGDAIAIFREGLNQQPNQQIIDELNRLMTRKPPVIRFLYRNNPINKYLGILFKALGLR
jgi:tetratricopeptide (TPR) repeat protein